MKKIIFFLSALFILSACNNSTEISSPQTETTPRNMQYASDNLSTNTSISSIDLVEVLSGGPPKDGIPAINNPQFQSISEANEWLLDESLGVFYTHNNKTRFYPYPILVWHEIVNDQIDDQNIAVTFCPLCGSSVIFNRDLEGETLNFGVSGKLWQSNLLMYDDKTETLWSQIIGKGVVGDYTNKRLEVFPTSTITYDQLKQNHPQAQVLSRDTGFSRNYDRAPYSGYEDDEKLTFPAKGSANTSFPTKELFIIAKHNNKDIGFQRQKLIDEGSATIEDYKAKINEDGTTTVFYQDKKIPHYIGMWFSWISHNDDPLDLEDFIIWPQS